MFLTDKRFVWGEEKMDMEPPVEPSPSRKYFRKIPRYIRLGKPKEPELRYKNVAIVVLAGLVMTLGASLYRVYAIDIPKKDAEIAARVQDVKDIAKLSTDREVDVYSLKLKLAVADKRAEDAEEALKKRPKEPQQVVFRPVEAKVSVKPTRKKARLAVRQPRATVKYGKIEDPRLRAVIAAWIFVKTRQQ